MYGFTPEDLPKRNLSFPIGEHISDVLLENCEYSSGDGWEAIDFSWSKTSNDGVQILRDRRFAVNEQNIQARDGETLDSAIERAYTNFNGIMNHIGLKYVTGEQLKAIRADNFEEFATLYCELLNSAPNKPLVYLKTLPNPNGYAQVGRYPRFCQLMSEGECTLSYTNSERARIENQKTNTNGVVEESTTHTPTSYV